MSESLPHKNSNLPAPHDFDSDSNSDPSFCSEHSESLILLNEASNNNAPCLKKYLIKDEEIRKILFVDSNENGTKISNPQNCCLSNIDQEIFNQIYNKIKEIGPENVGNCCKALVRGNNNGLIHSNLNHIQNKKNPNFLSLTAQVTGEEFIGPTSKRSERKFEVSKWKKTRKMDRDCIHKKIKARLFRYIKDTMKTMIISDLSNLKIPQKIISDVTFVYNKDLLDKTMQSIFSEKYYFFNSIKNISKICLEGKEEVLSNFMKKTVRDCYIDYLESDQFSNDLKLLNNDNYANTFRNYCNGFLEYYNQNINYCRFTKKKKESKSENSSFN